MKVFRSILLIVTLCCSLSINVNGKSWYKNFKGNVGSYPVEIHLCRYENHIFGYCYYTKFKQPVPVIGDAAGDSIRLLAYSNNSESENFDGVYRSGKFSGLWTHLIETDKTGEYSFDFKEDMTASAYFEFVYVEGSVKLIKGYKDSPEATYLEGCIWPTDKYEKNSLLRNEICSYKNMNTELKVIGNEFLNNRKKYFEDYLEQYNDITKEELEKIGYASSYNQDEQILTGVAYMDEKIAVLSNSWYAYTGGAHGNYATGYRIIDLENKKVITLNDIYSDEGINILPTLLEKNFRRQNEIKDDRPLSDWGLFTDTIRVTDNVCLTPGCVMFSYVPYEIGPYAMGEAVIYIPIDEAEKYLKPGIKKLIGR